MVLKSARKTARRRRFKLFVLVVMALSLAVLAWPREGTILHKIGIDKNLKVRRGLDLQGGVYLVYEAQIGQAQTADASAQEILKNTAAVIERRVNPGGAGEAIVQTASANRVIVQIPGLDNPQQAISTIGRTAQLEFFEVQGGSKLVPTKINGQDVKRATVDFVPNTGQPVVTLELKSGQSTAEFSELTGRLSGSANLLVTLLDQQVVFGPASVQSAITDGKAQLTGGFNVQQAKEIATLLNAGALPVPVKLVAQQTIGPTLGALSIEQSLVAAIIGLAAVSLFLLWYYRWAGLMAVFSLVFYTMALLTIIKLSVFTPYVIVLTLAGIAGFILSIAVAVDANVLIMERIKEELVLGKTPLTAAQAGFDHAWHSIRDANATTIISSAILYLFGAPLIRGFALTLGVGVAISLSTAFTVSRLLLKTLARSRVALNLGWIRLREDES